MRVYRAKDESSEGEMSWRATNRLSQTRPAPHSESQQRQENCFFSTAPRKALGPMGLVPPGVKRQERGAVHRPPPSTSVKNECSC